jgi:hypothetical protein
MNHERVKIKVASTLEAAEGVLFLSVPALKIAEYGNPETKVDLIVGAVGCPNVETTLRVGQKIEFDTQGKGVFEIRLLSAQNPIELLISALPRKSEKPIDPEKA